MKRDGTLTEFNNHKVPSPVILSGSNIYEGCASVLVTGLGENSNFHKYKKRMGCPIEMSLEIEWRAFCQFTKVFVFTTQAFCILVFAALLVHNINSYEHIDNDNFWFAMFEMIEVTLCLSVACIPTGYLKTRHDSWSRYCWSLSEKNNCTF